MKPERAKRYNWQGEDVEFHPPKTGSVDSKKETQKDDKSNHDKK